jgi:sterol desaturase/sphingolipid hydroxylase (fatty acid hydroxylase superfamily)
METSIPAWLQANYHWQLSLCSAAAVAAITFIGRRLLLLNPAAREAHELNQTTFRQKMEKPLYSDNQQRNRKWGGVYMAVIFGLILPFCLTTATKPWWSMVLDIVIILMFYDLLYYFVHRFLFHNGGVLGGPLLHIHAIHHQQHNPCRMDSSYLHPLEMAIGLGLYTGSIFILSRFMGSFHVVTIVITWVAFSQINLHNHDLWKEDRIAFRYLSYISKMHHNHHIRFIGGNFATISVLYDWMFGTLDNGNGYGKKAKV